VIWTIFGWFFLSSNETPIILKKKKNDKIDRRYNQWFEQYLADFSYLPIKLQLSLKKKKNQTPIIVSPFFSVKVKKKMVKFGWLSVSIGKTYEKFNSIFNKLIQKYNMFNQTSKVSPCSPKNILTRTY